MLLADLLCRGVYGRLALRLELQEAKLNHNHDQHQRQDDFRSRL